MFLERSINSRIQMMPDMNTIINCKNYDPSISWQSVRLLTSYDQADLISRDGEGKIIRKWKTLVLCLRPTLPQAL